MKNRVMFQIQPKYAQFDEWRALAERERFTFEVAELAFPLHNERQRSKMAACYQESGLVTSLHGAFIDINAASIEPEIAKISHRLMEGSCETAVELGAKQVVFHSSAFPFLRGSYLDRWVETSGLYFKKLADKYDLNICVENSWDLDPEPLRRLMEFCDDPRICVCLDAGHANYSRELLQSWFLELGPYIRYLHLSDNFGSFDDHMPLGVGTMPVSVVNDLCRNRQQDLVVTLEMETIGQAEKSIRFLKENHLFLWDDWAEPGVVDVREQRNENAPLSHTLHDLRLSEKDKALITKMKQKRTEKMLHAERELLDRVSRRYLSDDILQHILSDPEGMELGGRKQRITMLMSDLHGFTAASEHMEAQDLLTMLNHYYAVMTDVLHRYDGTTIDMIGDGLFVAFGLFGEGGNHADMAIAAALEMQKQMHEISKWNEKRGWPALFMGIGINTGDVIAGNVGSIRHMKYGLVGRQVNLTSRIEAYAHRNQVLITESTLMESDALLALSGVFAATPKGIRGETVLYEVSGIQW